MAYCDHKQQVRRRGVIQDMDVRACAMIIGHGVDLVEHGSFSVEKRNRKLKTIFDEALET